MASFFKKSESCYPQADVIEVLKPSEKLRQRHSDSNIYQIQRREDDAKSGQESWRVAFAPDESFFAWSCGNQYVVLVPLVQQSLTDDNTNCQIDNDIIPRRRVLNCGSTVYSVAFGSSTSNLKYEGNNTCWNLHRFNRNLILATGLQNGRISIWEVYTGRIILKLMDHTSIVRDVTFAPDGSLYLASASHDSTVKIWHLKDDGNMSKTLKTKNKHFMYSCAWSPDAKRLICVGKGRTAFIWDTTTFEIILQLHGHLNSISCCTFSPDGFNIATASYDTQVILWDSETGKVLRIFSHQFPKPSLIFASGENGTWVRGVSFSSDGCHIATVADDGYLRFWDLTKHEEEDPIEIVSIDKPLCCSYAPSGRVLAVGNHSGAANMVLAPMKIGSLRYLSRMAVHRLIFSKTIESEALLRILPEHFLQCILK